MGKYDELKRKLIEADIKLIDDETFRGILSNVAGQDYTLREVMDLKDQYLRGRMTGDRLIAVFSARYDDDDDVSYEAPQATEAPQADAKMDFINKVLDIVDELDPLMSELFQVVSPKLSELGENIENLKQTLDAEIKKVKSDKSLRTDKEKRDKIMKKLQGMKKELVNKIKEEKEIKKRHDELNNKMNEKNELINKLNEEGNKKWSDYEDAKFERKRERFKIKWEANKYARMGGKRRRRRKRTKKRRKSKGRKRTRKRRKKRRKSRCRRR